MIVDGELVVDVDPRGRALGPERAKELLAIGIDEGGVRHALYPTACRTLCGRTDDELDVRGDVEPPDCLACATAALAFDRIDRSAPASWFRHGRTAAA